MFLWSSGSSVPVIQNNYLIVLLCVYVYVCVCVCMCMQVEKVCVVALSTVNNIRESAEDNVKKQMREYLQQVWKYSLSMLYRRMLTQTEHLCSSIIDLYN